MITFSRFPPCALALSLALAAIAQARSSTGQSQDEAAARTLFLDGRRLAKEARYEEACKKFEAAKRLYTSSGLLLNLADCHERLHRTASAWAEFGDAAFAAAASGRMGDEAEAKRRQAALEGSLSRLALHVDAPLPAETVTRDGVPVDRAAWDSPIPLDPGEHLIAAEAAGRLPWSASVAVTEPGKIVTVEVPPLREALPTAQGGSTSPGAVAAEGATGASTATDDRAPRGKTQRLVGILVGAAGVGGMGAAGILGLVARSQYDAAQAESGPARVPDSISSGHLADVASVVLGVGAAATIAGAVLWLTAPRAPVSVGTNGTSVYVAGSF